MRMFAGKDFTKGMVRFEWTKPEDVVLRFDSKDSPTARQKRQAAKKGQAAVKAKRSQIDSAKTRKSRVRPSWAGLGKAGLKTRRKSKVRYADP